MFVFNRICEVFRSFVFVGLIGLSECFIFEHVITLCYVIVLCFNVETQDLNSYYVNAQGLALTTKF